MRMLASPAGCRRGPRRRRAPRSRRRDATRSSSGSGIARPAARPRSRATCSGSSVGRPAPRAQRLEHAVAELEAAVERREVGASAGSEPRRRARRERAAGRHPPRPRVAADRRAAARAPSRPSRPTPRPGRSVGDPAADVEAQPRAVGDERPDEDRGRHRPVRPDPAERPRVRPAPTGSSSSSSSIARIFGAPVIEPPGNERARAGRTRRGPAPAARSTVETRCWTAAVRSSRHRRGTRTLPGRQTRPEIVPQDVHDHHVLGAVLARSRGARMRAPGPRRASGRAAASP